MARPDAVYAVPGRVVVHLNDLKAVPSGVRVDVRGALSGFPSDTILVQNLGKKAIRVHLDRRGMATGHATVRGGEDLTVRAALDEFFVSGSGDSSFNVTLVGRP